MEIKINIEKRHLYIFSVIIGILIGVFAVNAFNPSGTGGVPSNFGHSVDEIDWSKQINSDVQMRGIVLGNGGLTVNSNSNLNGLTVNGQIILSGIFPGDGRVLTSTAAGSAYWESLTNHIRIYCESDGCPADWTKMGLWDSNDDPTEDWEGNGCPQDVVV